MCYLSDLRGKASHLHSQVSYSFCFRFHGHHFVLDRFIIEAPWHSCLTHLFHDPQKLTQFIVDILRTCDWSAAMSLFSFSHVLFNSYSDDLALSNIASHKSTWLKLLMWLRLASVILNEERFSMRLYHSWESPCTDISWKD